MAKILVTGARGLLGSTLMPLLRSRGHELFRNDRTGGGEARVELTDIDQVRTALDAIRPEVIINLAAFTDVDGCERKPQQAYSVNVKIVRNLVAWIQDNLCSTYLVQLSTDQLYDGEGPHKEDDLTLTNYYGFSKYAGELVAAAVPSTILRTNFFGPSRCPNRASLTDWLMASARRVEKITVFEDIKFTPLSLETLTGLVDLAVSKRIPGVFNVGSKNGMSKADFAYAFIRALGLGTSHMSRGTSAGGNRAAYRPGDMRMNSSRFESAFGVSLPDLDEEIKSMRVAYAQ